MKDEFDSWSKLKKKLEIQGGPLTNFPKRGEVWMSTLGKNIGFEQNGGGTNFSRPVLIIRKFNNHMFWIVSLSTKQKNLDFYFNYTDPAGQPVSVILAQLRLISIKRIGRKLYELEVEKVEKVRLKIRSFV